MGKPRARKGKHSFRKAQPKTQDFVYKKFVEPNLESLRERIKRFFPEDPAMAEDLVQETVAKTITLSPKYGGKRKAKAFLFEVARNRIKKIVRQKARERTGQAPFHNFFATIIGKTRDPYRIVANSLPEQKRQIKKIFEKAGLSPREEKVLSYYFGFFDGMPKTAKETAANFKTTVGAIKMVLVRGTKKIRKKVQVGFLKQL